MRFEPRAHHVQDGSEVLPVLGVYGAGLEADVAEFGFKPLLEIVPQEGKGIRVVNEIQA